MAPRAIICDIEGTTSSISFVHRVLFPLSLERMDAYLEANRHDQELESQLANLSERIGSGHALGGESERLQALSSQLKDYIRNDVKDTTLKWVQGKIWKQAFESGAVKGHVYPEVPEYLRRWKSAGRSIFIYSSGSVEAQQLLFRHSEAGDLTDLIDGYFDTNTGMKREIDSYRKIVAASGFAAGEMLFLSDIREELDAAAGAGLKTCLLLRENAVAPADYRGKTAADFSAVDTQFFA